MQDELGTPFNIAAVASCENTLWRDIKSKKNVTLFPSSILALPFFKSRRYTAIEILSYSE